MNPVELIRRKRNGENLSRSELEEFIGGYVKGSLPDYQMTAFLMAVFFKGMSTEETRTFTEVMLNSGQVIDLSSLSGVKVDKHSTGGVGDKVSLILAPMVAACGVRVPMISGRGLGHTGGTLDKLESIPGFRTNLSVDEYKKIVRELSVVLIGQTEQIAPADRKMYALRDVTATVESIPLIAGSIMSKKLAEGIDALVLDIKTGNGAFMRSQENSLALGTTLVELGNQMGKKTVGFITDMNQPLGTKIGNWLEVVESVECLKGKRIPDLMEVTYVLGGAMVWLGGRAESIQQGMKLCQDAIWSGKAYERFLQLVARQGGDTQLLENLERYPEPAHYIDVTSPLDGYVAEFDTFGIGVLATELGAGRLKVDDVIDPKAGIQLRKKVGDAVTKGESIATLSTDKNEVVQNAAKRFLACVSVKANAPALLPAIYKYIDDKGQHSWSSPALY